MGLPAPAQSCCCGDRAPRDHADNADDVMLKSACPSRPESQQTAMIYPLENEHSCFLDDIDASASSSSPQQKQMQLSLRPAVTHDQELAIHHMQAVQGCAFRFRETFGLGFRWAAGQRRADRE